MVWNQIKLPKQAENAVDLASCIVAMCSCVVAYVSLNRLSMGTECLILGALLTAYYYRKVGRISLPSMTMAILAVGALILVGRFGDRGFDAPVGHSLKFVFLFYAVVMAAMVIRMRKSHKRLLLLAIGVAMVISCLISVYCTLFLDEYAMRYFEAKGFTQVLDFNQVYSIPLMTPICVYYLLSNWKRMHWGQAVAVALFIALLLFTVLQSLYTFALLLTIFSTGLAVLAYLFCYDRKKLLWLCGIAAVLLVLCFIFRQPLSDFLYDLTENLNYLVRARIRSVIDMVLGTKHDNWYEPETRNELLEFSINTFLANPIFGVGYGHYGYGIVGGHQEWPDMLAVFGVVGTVLVIAILIYSFLRIYKLTKTLDGRVAMLLSGFCLVFLGFLNPCLAMPQLLTVFVIAPNIPALTGGENKRKKK